MRVLLAIGCDDYRSAPPLRGAVNDATSVFSTLVGREHHQYDPDRSKLLISPTGEQFRQTISSILYENREITVFTLYFAGHAVVFDETLYLAPVDTAVDRIPASAIGFPDVLRTTAGARPKQANFVIDACNAAGLGFDIGTILKRTIVGNSDTMGISFLASSAAEQSAQESPEGGRFTIEFTKILRGETFVQQASPFLSLAEIAQQIQSTTKLDSQAISYWSLNLQGPNLFATNANFSGPAYAVDDIASRFKNQKIEIGKHAADFKSELAKIITGISERTLARRLENVFSEIKTEQRPSLIYGLAAGLKLELAEAQDVFLEARVHSVLLGQLLGLCSPITQSPIVTEIIDWHTEANSRALLRLNEALDADRNALLDAGFSDLYELPIRISDIFGYCALFLMGQRTPSIQLSNLVFDTAEKILQRYGNSVVALTDEQATGYLLFLETCRANKWTNLGEEIAGRLYHDLHENFARCADYSLNAESQFRVIGERYKESYTLTRDVYSAPSDLTTVIVSFCALLNLDEAIDETLIEIDHTPINYFVPTQIEQFGLCGDMEGTNYTLALGHDFWRCIDLRRILHGDIFPKLQSSASLLSWEARFCAAAGSLALRDRLPWFVVRT
ncbi:caspase family protein [Bradyrhizobium sp. 195]|uniref:caspase family protein n=1 Tax=Bradyrhizobium sp. 195 TaxID=2782662 RepID=UPI002000F9E5|nr:caspase family protein [Bradyrhizobium sp. 195]UPK26238.1 caspase family protein [Bradyrhizobium sp. 195]